MTACPRCGEPATRGQEYCLECGTRLPGSGPGGARDPGSGWILRTAVSFVVALVGAAVAVAATGGSEDRAAVVTATGGFATVPASSTVPTPSETGGPGVVEWPAGEDGWTIALASLPQTRGRGVAVARTREAGKAGLPQVGILDSSRYASLHPGYWIVFTGIYASEAEATSALEPARRHVRTAAVRRVVP
ncbi:MAG TPA: zinc ribbon domain-containing protein [Gaiellaceae bacterium]|nr:zinc ribbon domain-containing protein [Gaiellaceae bacterium]